MKIYDLSCTIEQGIWDYGTPYVPYETEKIATRERNGYITHKHILTSHTGTHLENAKHWWDDAEGTEKLPLDRVMGKCRVLKFDVGETPFYAIDTQMLKAAGAEELERGDICMVVTGWDRRIREANYIWESPFLTVEAAEYLKDRGIKAFAIDAPMFGDPRDGMDVVPEGTEVPDFAFAKNGIPCILGLVDCQQLPDQVYFVAAPLKLKGADGSPVRAFAVEMEER